MAAETVREDVHLVHGHPASPAHGFLRSPTDVRAAREQLKGRALVLAHTHFPARWDARDREHPVQADERVSLARGALVNPGAVCDPDGPRWLELRLTGGPAATWHQLPPVH